MSDLIGHVDARGRPILSLPTLSQDDELLLIVDTGFNGTLLLHDRRSALRSGEIAPLEEMVEFADRERRSLLLARSQILWFGRPLDVDVLVSPIERSRAAAADEPVGLIGTSLLAPHHLTIDFAARRLVLVERQE